MYISSNQGVGAPITKGEYMSITFNQDSLRNLADITKGGKVGKHAFRTLIYICSVMDVDNKAKVDQQKLAERLEVSGQTLYMATKALCEYGFIAKAVTNTRSKTFIVNPALALASDKSDYEAIMTLFSDAQSGVASEEVSAEAEVPEFIGIPEGAEA